MSNPLKLIVIVGSTASGKSELAVKIAEKFNGEIISADSRQIYRGLDIGTGKVTGAWSHAPVIPADAGIQGIKNKESGFPIKACPRPDRGSGMTKQNNREVFLYKNIPHHCIDCVSPKKIFTVAEYKKCAEAGIKDIAARGKLPIMAGGTGFWIDAVAYNMQFPRVPPNDALRKRLKKKSADKLFEMLKHSDPERAKTIDKKNPRRLIRAIEIALALGKVPRMMRASPYRILWIGLKKSPEELKKKISARLRARIKQGMIREGERLRKQGISWKRLYELGLEYRFLADYLRGNSTKKEMRKSLENAIWQYARRQMTWFKRNRDIHWITAPARAIALVRRFQSE